MKTGFAVMLDGDGAEFRRYAPETDGASPLLATFEEGGTFAVLLGRLYYRQELLGALRRDLPGPLAEAARRNDAALALAAYRCLGIAGLGRLEGDFSLAIWDGERRELIGARDPVGGYPLFWTEA
ncbi:MAG TPA: hypothetical protein VFU47_04790, partial [Armatimonadota bacterium]|nr:hypothetical protein [Armatimonadota bacterium]